MSYQEAVLYLESFVNYEKISNYPYNEALSLKRVQGFLDSLNNPERSLKCIQVAGTKGKGSTCAFLAYILREAGFKAGLYTSPHLLDFRERIRILYPKNALSRTNRSRGLNLGYGSGAEFEGMISKSKLAGLVDRLKPAIIKYNRCSRYGPLTFFEATTALAFVYFQESKVDLVVLETGLGGRLDATNVVNPLVSLITPISYEHMDKLGRTLKAIAKEKAGIIKRQKTEERIQGLVVISAPQKKEALEAVRNKCRKSGAKLLLIGKDIKYSGKENDFRVSSPAGNYKNLKIRLIGAHQMINAASAIAAVGILGDQGIHIGIDSLSNGLYNTVWPGRCEIIGKTPFVVLDGAQNMASANVLRKTIQERFRYKRLILLLGVSNDKDIKGIAQELKDLADKVILTKSNNPRAASPEDIRKYFSGKDVYIADSVKKAKSLALRLAHKQDLILVTGSLFVVGEARGTVSALVRKQFPL